MSMTMTTTMMMMMMMMMMMIMHSLKVRLHSTRAKTRSFAHVFFMSKIADREVKMITFLKKFGLKVSRAL